MKYATICALLLAQAEANSCKPGVKVAFWSGKNCTEKPTTNETLDTEDEINSSFNKCAKTDEGTRYKMACSEEGITLYTYSGDKGCSK